MALTLYAHPFAAYSWKALIALYENDTPFDYRIVDNPEAIAELESLWPLKKFPVLTDGASVLIESTVIIEHLTLHHAGVSRLIPADIDAALDVRFMDRVFDNYVMIPTQKIVGDRLRAGEDRDAKGVVEARSLLDSAYGWLDHRLRSGGWATGRNFSLADCAAAPALFYSDWVHPIKEKLSVLRHYRSKLLARPSIVRTVEEARPYRHFFPGGAPDRD